MENLEPGKLRFESQLSCITLNKILAFLNFQFICKILGNDSVNLARFLERFHDIVCLAEQLPHRRQWFSGKCLLALIRLYLLL